MAESETGESKNAPASPEQQRDARRAVDALLVNRYRKTRVDADGTRKPATNDTEGSLDTYFSLSQGESPQLAFDGGNPIKLSGLKTAEGEEPFKDQDLELAEVRGASADGKFLNCYAKGPDGKILLREGGTDPDNLNDRVLIELPREEVLLLQLKSQPEEYKGMVDEDKKKLMEAVIEDDGKLPDNLDALVDDVKAETGMPIRDEDFPETLEATVEKPIDHVLNKQLERVAKKIAELKPTPKEGEEAKKLTPHEEKLYEEFTRIHDNLRVAIQAKGPFGPLLQNAVLKQVNVNQNIGSTTDIATFLEDPAWDTEVDNAARDFAGLLEDKGLDQKERKRAIEKLKDPAGLDKLMQHKKLNDSGQKILRDFFGRDLEATEIDDIRNTITDLLDSNRFDPVTKARIKMYGKGVGIIALIIAAIPAVALALTTAAAVGTPATLAGASGRR